MEPETASCRICGHPMPAGARKCTKCGEYQSTLSRIAAGFDLKGILALLPLLTLIYAFLADRLEIPRSGLVATALECRSDGVSVFATNPGNRTTLVQAATFTASGDAPGIFTLPVPRERIIEPDDAYIFDLTVDRMRNPGGLASFQARGRENCSVAITIDYLTHDRRKRQETTSCDCPAS